MQRSEIRGNKTLTHSNSPLPSRRRSILSQLAQRAIYHSHGRQPVDSKKRSPPLFPKPRSIPPFLLKAPQGPSYNSPGWSAAKSGENKTPTHSHSPLPSRRRSILPQPAQRATYLGHGRQPVDSNVDAPLSFPKAPQGPSLSARAAGDIS